MRKTSVLLAAAISLTLVGAVLSGLFFDALGPAGVQVLSTAYITPLAVAFVVLTKLRTPRDWAYFGALILSFVADVFGGAGNQFVVQLLLFLLVLVCIGIAFAPLWRQSLIVTPYALIYLAVFGLMIGSLLPLVSASWPAVLVYSIFLLLMTLLATGAGYVGLLGGAVFAISNLSLVVGRYLVELPAATVHLVVVLGYSIAQALLLVAYLSTTDARSALPRSVLNATRPFVMPAGSVGPMNFAATGAPAAVDVHVDAAPAAEPASAPPVSSTAPSAAHRSELAMVAAFSASNDERGEASTSAPQAFDADEPAIEFQSNEYDERGAARPFGTGVAADRLAEGLG